MGKTTSWLDEHPRHPVAMEYHQKRFNWFMEQTPQVFDAWCLCMER